MSAAAPVLKRRVTTRQKMLGIVGIGAVVIGLQQLADFADNHAFMINQTESLPNWAFTVEGGVFPKRGELVVFHPGHDPLTKAYFGEGQAFTKIATGVPGDVVTREGADVFVNGELVARTKPETKQGEPLSPGPVGEVPRGCVFATTPHKDGFDSRYDHIGFVCTDRLTGIASPIL